MAEAGVQDVSPWTNFITYSLSDDASGTRVGHLEMAEGMIRPLAHASGAFVSTLYEVIEAGYETLTGSTKPIPLSSVKVLPPLAQRDVLAVGKNYVEHAKEFNASGYDASDTKDIPEVPVIFTKRATSIIADGKEILPHPSFTETLDYEGEIGAIIGKTGFRIPEDKAHEHIWGYTIINDVTAREKQRDHKQFYIGKSADTFCPMGPIAVPAQHLPLNLEVTTKVNGEVRQKSSIQQLIFSVPFLVAKLSESQTLQAGDVIATGTPAGVGFGLNPPKFLKPKDVIEVSVTGLGTLRNRVADYRATNRVLTDVTRRSCLPISNLERTLGGVGLLQLPSGKKLHIDVQGSGSNRNAIIFLHGLGSSSTYWTPLTTQISRDYTCIAPDLEGHGLSPTSAASKVTLDTLIDDLLGIYEFCGIKRATLCGHSLGGLIASTFTMRYPDKVTQLLLLGPSWYSSSSLAKRSLVSRAARARLEGMKGIATLIAYNTIAGTSRHRNPHAHTAVLSSLTYTHPEGYAKLATALAEADVEVQLGAFKRPVLVLSGSLDQPSHATVQRLAKENRKVRSVVMDDVGHWHLFEDFERVKNELARYIPFAEDTSRNSKHA